MIFPVKNLLRNVSFLSSMEEILERRVSSSWEHACYPSISEAFWLINQPGPTFKQGLRPIYWDCRNHYKLKQ
ncbi:MAG: hypothetical protein A2Z14_11940 [Chloroflexi bacterium RBG_16_48_8]|nr:MAG: hypothetical protein A2Z14_11940 [Chloroflexi bacterium RBG_16_48_8]